MDILFEEQGCIAVKQLWVIETCKGTPTVCHLDPTEISFYILACFLTILSEYFHLRLFFFFQQHIPWPPMPPAPAPVSSSSGTAENEDALASMLMSWYLTGYHTGYYQVKQNSESLVEDSY